MSLVRISPEKALQPWTSPCPWSQPASRMLCHSQLRVPLSPASQSLHLSLQSPVASFLCRRMQLNQLPLLPSAPVATQPVKESTPPPPVVSVPTKPVWSTEDDKKKNSGGPTSLREIQEMEAKRQEARKAAERERSRAPATASAPVSEDSQTFTASWGLPTSQVGAKSSAKDTPGIMVPSASASTSASVTISSPTSPPSAPLAVWTNTQKSAAKKSMRDILDEEERRKKAAFKEPVAANAPRRAYAETTNKVRRRRFDVYLLLTIVSFLGEFACAIRWGMDHYRCQRKSNGGGCCCVPCRTSDGNPIRVHWVSSLVQRNRYHCCHTPPTSKRTFCGPQG